MCLSLFNFKRKELAMLRDKKTNQSLAHPMACVHTIFWWIRATKKRPKGMGN